MGGFRVNGCGVTDHFKTIKRLGVYNCPNCKQLTEISLEEASQKVDVFFIPTLTIKSRYAVLCKKCRSGEFCSAEWAGYLMNQTTPRIIFESTAKKKGWSAATRSFQNEGVQQLDGITSAPAQQPGHMSVTPSVPVQKTSSVLQTSLASDTVPGGFGERYILESSKHQPVKVMPTTVRQSGAVSQVHPAPAAERQSPSSAQTGMAGTAGAPMFFKCPGCGVTQMREGNYCAYCGKPAPEAEIPGQKKSAGTGMLICPGCGNSQEVGNKFCFKCGWKLKDEPAGECKCPNCGVRVTDGMLFCMECGTRL